MGDLWWQERRWGVRALTAMGKTNDALRYAEGVPSKARGKLPAMWFCIGHRNAIVVLIC